jgi:hypothetical protein
MTDKTKTNSSTQESFADTTVVDFAVNQDLKHSILIVSLVVNLVVFTTWIALQVTTQYDTQIASLLFAR